jgi:peptidoglycan/LPS O-acetylase OafA/YrhL
LKTSYFPALDGLRAISIFLVICFHVKTKAPFLRDFPGYLGVDVFFVLSGYLITMLLLREKQETGKIDLTAFYMRRIFRIIPVYLFVFMIYFLVTHSSPSKWELFKGALPYYLTFTNEFVPRAGTPFSGTWTLGIEEKFYLVWPFLFFFVLRGRMRQIALPFLYLIPIGMTAFSQNFIIFRLGRAYSALLIGCVLALFLSSHVLPSLKTALSKIPALLTAALVLIGGYLVIRDQLYIFAFAWLVAIMIANLQLSDSWLRRALSNSWLTWVGRRSYGMYLIHGLVINAVEALVHPVNPLLQIAGAVFTFGATALIAEPMFRFVEEPARRYGKTLILRRSEKWSGGEAIPAGHVAATNSGADRS